MKPSSKNEVINGVIKAYLAQKDSDADIANSWEVFNGGDNVIPYTYDLSKSTWAGMRADLEEKGYKFVAGTITFEDGHNAKCLVWNGTDVLEMADIGALPYYVDGKRIENAETADSVLQALFCISYGVGDGVSNKKFEDLVKVTPTDINVDSNGFLILDHDGKEITGQKKNFKAVSQATFNTALEAKSNSKYHHTITLEVTITDNTTGSAPATGYLSFNAMLSTNTPIDSYQDMHTYLGGNSYALTGMVYDPSSKLMNHGVMIDLHGGTPETDKIIVVNNDGDSTNITLTYLMYEGDNFKSTLTITDDVFIPR